MTVVAGIVRASCSCCETPTELVSHIALGTSRRMCAQTRKTYVDRGDGVFLQDATPVQVLLDDRPTRTEDKTRIQLERATFAGEQQIGTHRFEVDLDAALRCTRGLDVYRLEREIQAMGRRFSRWVLTLSDGGRLKRCNCEGLLVFEAGVRCVACKKLAKTKTHQLAWFGLMPPIGVDGLKRVAPGLMAQPPRGHIVGHRPEIGSFLLVPLVAAYPGAFPHSPVQIHYLPEFRRVPGMPSEEVSHTFHMLPGQQMCLFAAGQWTPETTMADALAERAYPHVIKLLNYCNGKHDAFAIVS